MRLNQPSSLPSCAFWCAKNAKQVLPGRKSRLHLNRRVESPCFSHVNTNIAQFPNFKTICYFGSEEHKGGDDSAVTLVCVLTMLWSWTGY
jgi:hypothetical protein